MVQKVNEEDGTRGRSSAQEGCHAPRDKMAPKTKRMWEGRKGPKKLSYCLFIVFSLW